MTKDEIEFGIVCRDRVTGFEGVVVAHTKYITGCDRVTLQPKVGEDNKIQETQTFDYMCLEIVDNESCMDVEDDVDEGGPELYQVKCKV